MNTRRFLIITFLGWIAASIAGSGAVAQNPPPPLDGFEEYVARMMADWKVPGGKISGVVATIPSAGAITFTRKQ